MIRSYASQVSAPPPQNGIEAAQANQHHRISSLVCGERLGWPHLVGAEARRQRELGGQRG